MTGPRCARVGRLLCLGGAALGALGLLGWIVEASALTTVFPDEPPMMPNTALALLLVGGAGALRQRQDARPVTKALSLLAAVAVLAIGIGTLAEYALQIDLQIDPLIVHTAAGPHPGRPSPPTAVALTLLAAAVVLFDFRVTARARPSEWLILLAGLTAFASLTGFILGAGPLYRLSRAPVIGVALETSLSLLLISTGLLLERPASGVMRVVTSPGPGGVLLRRLVFPVLLAAVLFGLVVTRVSASVGIEQLSVEIAILTATTTVVSLVLLTVTAVPLNRTEAKLRESEERFRLAFEEAPIGMALISLDGRFVRVNRVLCETVGYTAEELTGLTFQEITHPEDLDSDLALAGQLARGEIPRYQLEKRYIRKDGATVDIMLSSSVVRGPDGAPLHFIAQIEDVTERKRAQEAIWQSQERFELALEGADLASWDWNVTTGEVFFNRRWAEMRGFRPEEVTPRVDSWLSGIHADDRPRVERALTDYFEGRSREYAIELRVRTKAGRWLWILDRGKIFERDEAGRPIRMVGTELDITERKRTQDEQTFLADVGRILASTLEFEDTLARIAQLSVARLADCVIVDVVEGRDQVRHVLVVHADPVKDLLCDKLKQFRLNARRPHLPSAIFESKQAILISEMDPEFLDTVAQSEEHLRALRELDIKSVIAVPLLARERLLGGLVFMSSVPTRRYDQRDLELAKELATRAALAVDNALLYETARRATELRDEVLGIVAHDLRNPLGSILLQVDLLTLRAPEPARKPAEAIKRSATRMNRLIQDLLDVARMEAGQLTIERGRVPAVQVLTDAVEAHATQATSRSLELRLDLAQDLPEVRADRHRLLQVLENLVGNALKFTPAGGCITIGAARREADVLFWVGDTGSGIPAEDQEHVFDRFWQARGGGRSGAGLGLPIVKGIVEAHGGRVWVESSPGFGTTFFFTIPMAHGTDAWRAEAAPSGPDVLQESSGSSAFVTQR